MIQSRILQHTVGRPLKKSSSLYVQFCRNITDYRDNDGDIPMVGNFTSKKKGKFNGDMSDSLLKNADRVIESDPPSSKSPSQLNYNKSVNHSTPKHNDSAFNSFVKSDALDSFFNSGGKGDNVANLNFEKPYKPKVKSDFNNDNNHKRDGDRAFNRRSTYESRSFNDAPRYDRNDQFDRSNRNHSFERSNDRSHYNNSNYSSSNDKPRSFYNDRYQNDRFNNQHDRFSGDRKPFGFQKGRGEPDLDFHRQPDFIHNKRPRDRDIIERNVSSQWSEMRGNSLMTPHLPVPIVGEALYGVHAVLSSLMHDARSDFHSLYVISNLYDEIQRDLTYADREAANKKQPLRRADAPVDSVSSDDLTALKGLFDIEDSSFDDFSDPFAVPVANTPLVRGPTERQRGSKEAVRLVMELAKERKIRIFSMSRQKMDMLSENRPHNGVVLDVSPIQVDQSDTLDYEDAGILNEDSTNTKPCVWIALDRIQDPQNVGAIVRSAAFFGAKGIVMTKSDSSPLTPVAAKAASGALDGVMVKQCRNLGDFIRLSRELHDGFYSGDTSVSENDLNSNRSWGSLCVIGLSANIDSVECYNVEKFIKFQQAKQQNQPFSILLVVGNEGAGFSPDVSSGCHFHMTIPLLGSGPLTADHRNPQHKLKGSVLNSTSFKPLLDSLNVSSAAAIALHQVSSIVNDI